MYKINEECYILKEINYNTGIFDNCIDCTYVIHLEGNGRLNNIMTQLKKYKPTKKNFILFNKGFKNCKKNKIIDKPWKDLVEANFYIFLHAKKNNFQNILILEDDCYFDDEILNKNTQNNITNFINNKKDTSFLYSLGYFSLITIPLFYDINTHYSPFFLTTHSCIFSKKYRDNILNLGLDKIFEKNMGWDIGLNPSGYIYHKPLCYQLFTDSDNKKNWENCFVNKIISVLDMDKDSKFGFHLINSFLKYIFWILIVIVIVIIIYISINYKKINKIIK
jgi:hypothetical protein